MISLAEQRLVEDAARACNMQIPSSDQSDALMSAFTNGELVDVCRKTIAGDQTAGHRLVHLVRVARAHTAACKELKMPYATIDRLDIARQQDPERFTTMFNDALAKDPNAISVIKKWLIPDGIAQSPRDAAPVHPTHLPPPPAASSAPVDSPSRQPAQAASAAPAAPRSRDQPVSTSAPPRAREATPVGRVDRAVSDHRSDRGSSSNNVHELHRSDRNDSGSATGGHGQPQSTAAERIYDQVICYGRDSKGGTALQFDNSPTRDRKCTTINLSIARAKGARTQDGVNWDGKIVIMLEPHEVQLILSVLMGDLPSARFAGHGPANDKWIEVSEITDPKWAGQVAFTLAQGKAEKADIRRCGVSPTDIGEVIGVFNRALVSQLRGVAPVSADRVAARTADLYSKVQNRKSEQPNQRAAR